jgi:hypothetical protein
MEGKTFSGLTKAMWSQYAICVYNYRTIVGVLLVPVRPENHCHDGTLRLQYQIRLLAAYIISTRPLVAEVLQH